MRNKIKAFYSSIAWKNFREAYKKSVGGLCEECYKNGRVTPAVDVHHIVKLTDENINDPEIALNEKNCVALCKLCHEKRHRKNIRRYNVDPYGRVTINPDYEE